jgi:carbonic anhydrase
VTTIETLSRRNREFAATRFKDGLQMMPKLKTIVIGCVDPRVDPTLVLGLELGDAVVIRNIAGRITPATLQSIMMLRLIAEAESGTPGPGWNLIVVHHTDCGINHLTDHPDLLAQHLGVDKRDFDATSVTDPYATVAADVAALKANPFLPSELTVSGLVYDVSTGLMKRVVAPAPVREADPAGT